MLLRLVLGILLASRLTLTFATETGSLRVAIRDDFGPLPRATATVGCPADWFKPWTTMASREGNAIWPELPVAAADESGCTVDVSMPGFEEVRIVGVTIEPGRERVIPVFLRRVPLTGWSSGIAVACPSLSDLLPLVEWRSKMPEGCERLDSDRYNMPVLKRLNPIFGGYEIAARQVRTTNGSALWMIHSWRKARDPRVLPRRWLVVYRAYYVSRRVPVQRDGGLHHATTTSFFEPGETILVLIGSSEASKPDRLPVMMEEGYPGWIDPGALAEALEANYE